MIGVPKFTAQEFRDLAAGALAGKDLTIERGTLAAMCLFAAELVDQHWRRGPHTLGARPVLTQQSKQARVDVAFNGEHLQLGLDKAREMVSVLVRAIESAATDELMYRFLTERIGLPDDRAALAILEFHELRQPSRS